MKLWSAIFLIARAWTPPVTPDGEIPETVAEYEERLETDAYAIEAAAEDETRPWWPKMVRAAGVLVVWREENRFDRYIHAGLPHPDPRKHQDHGRARCQGSIHPSKLIPEWPFLAGTSLEATTLCARATMRVLRSSVWMCAHGEFSEDAMARALEQYATGAKTCQEPGKESKKRAAMWMKVARRLDKETGSRTKLFREEKLLGLGR